MTRMKLWVVMEDVTSVWSNLGSGMGMAPQVRDELEKMRVEIRDIKLSVAKDITELREVVGKIGFELDRVISKQLSIMTRIEGLESRAQTIGSVSGEFNAFAYVQLDELELSNEQENQLLEERAIDPVQPDGSEEVEVVDTNNAVEEKEISDEEIALQLYDTVLHAIEVDGGILNNRMHSKYPAGLEVTSGAKKLLKGYLLENSEVELSKRDRFRTLYYKKGGDADELYKQIYG